MKDILIAGDTLDFVTSVPDYPASAGYTLKYRLLPRVSGTPIDLTAATSGTDDYRVIVAPATTANWTAGEYSWSSWVEQTGERHVVDEGLCTIQVNPAAISAYDGRSQAAKAVDDLKLALATYTASNGHIAEYSINGRSMKFKSAADIVQLLNFWQLELQKEEAAAAMAKGLANPRRYYLRAGRA